MAARGMIPFRVYLRSEQIESLRWLAERRKVSVAELVRQGVDRILAKVPAEEDSLWNLVGVSDSGLGDLAEKHDEYVAKMIYAENHR
jgi:hypothetical protein